ncbi:Transmembrane protein 134 [Myotis davidii]|uniref:Transmembrane protein 134 n=1 Tax=Myotis davidii TaxID=225400 RepID=L5LF38_MYODS|nr:Transmembrane protein 134 [Myotis davidii]
MIMTPLPSHWAHLSCRDSGRTSSVRSSQWSFSTISNSTQRSYNACCSWTQHPLIQKNRKVVLAAFLLLLLGLVLILVGVGLEVAPSPGVSSAIFFVPGFLLLVPGGAALVPVLAKGTPMTQAWGLEAAILVPAWLWGPGRPQPALNVGHDKAAAQPPPPTALLPRPKGWEE